MIAIPTTSLNFTKAFKTYKTTMPKLVEVRLDKAILKAPNTGHTKLLLRIVKKNLVDILLSQPNDLIRLSLRFQRYMTTVDAHGAVQKSPFAVAIEYTFNYDWFIDKTINRYSAYHLTEDLDVNVCVYCNRTYTHTIIKHDGRKIARPTLDHFFNKATHRIISVSFYNLIPSCGVCNSGIKHEADFQLPTHYHPYLDRFLDKFEFSYKFSSKKASGLEIILKMTDAKTVRTLFDLETKELYNTHTNELREMLAMRYKFSDNYLRILEKHVLKGTLVSQKELYRIAFGVELDPEDFGMRPFSKFKNDILKELSII